LDPLSSTKTQSLGSKAPCACRQAARSSSSRSLAVSFFWVRPVQGAAGPGHGPKAHGLTGGLLPALTMVEQAVVGMGFELGFQGCQGFRAREGAARAGPVRFGRQALARAALGPPASQGGQRDLANCPWPGRLVAARLFASGERHPGELTGASYRMKDRIEVTTNFFSRIQTIVHSFAP
jgi:hypothetical protein